MKLILKISLLFIVSLCSIQLSAQSNEFDKRWNQVDSLQDKGLYRMAQKEVSKIFNLGSEKGDHNQVIKAVLYELKFNSYLEEDDYVLGISKLDSLVETAPSPSKEILHSLTAEVYWGYYNSNSWKFQDRTNAPGYNHKDIRTYDLKKIAEKVRDHYILSLQNASISQKAQIRDFAEIATYTDTKETAANRPTLYDFLAYRAFNYFSNADLNLSGPAETFLLKDDRLIGSNTSFINAAKTATSDSLNFDYFAIQVLCQLTKFHQSNQNENALFHVELERLKYLQSSAVIKDLDTKYYQGLERLTQAYQKKSFVSEAWYEIARYHHQKAGKYVFPSDTTYRWDNQKAMEICKKVQQNFPDTYGSQNCAALENQIGTKTLAVRCENAVPVNKKDLFFIEYKNVSQLYYKIVDYDYKKYNKKKYRYDELPLELQKLKAVKKGQIELTDPKDYQSHKTEILLPELDNGFYFLVVSSDPDFKSVEYAFNYTPFWVSDITYQSQNDFDETTVLISDRNTGLPLEGAKATVHFEEYSYLSRKYESKTLGSFTANAEGKFSFKPSPNSYNYTIKVNYKDQLYAPSDKVYAYKSNSDNDPFLRTELFTDRTIYRPGQTIFFKGIVLECEGEKRTLKKNHSTKVYFYDANYQKVAEQEVTTNEFGSFQGEFNAPIGVLTGQMHIQESHGSTYFRVEEYKRPKFSAEFKAVEGQFELNDSILVTGFAKAFAGNMIDGAEVKYRITRSTAYGGYWNWWYYRNQAQPKEVLSGVTQTDENGEFNILFKAIPDETKDPKLLPQFTYNISADITDINGETHSAQTSLVVGYQSLVLGANIKPVMNGDRPFVLKMSTTNLNGQDVSAKGAFKISKLQTPATDLYSRYWEQPDYPSLSESEFKEIFPNRAYSDEDDQTKWEVEKEVLKMSFDTKITDSIPLKSYSKWNPGVYKYEATAFDKNGIEVKDIRYFTYFKPNSKKVPNNETFWLKKLKTKAEPGEKVSIILSSKSEDLKVYYDIEVKNKIEESGSLTLSNEQRRISYLVEEKHRGNFTVHFVAIKNNRRYAKSITFVVPHTDKELDLTFSTFRNKLIPGQNEEWTLTVKNKKGKKEQAELLAVLYDASLDELYAPNSFYLNIYNSYYGNRMFGAASGMGVVYGQSDNGKWNNTVNYPYRYFPVLNYHGYSTYYYGSNYYIGGYPFESSTLDFANYDMDELEDVMVAEENMLDDQNAPKVEEKRYADSSGNGSGPVDSERDKKGEQKGVDQNLLKNEITDLSGVKVRSNFNETAFFYPQLNTDENGDIKIKFTIPESLTKWRFSGLGHTKDLKVGYMNEEVITQKDLMVVPNVPRFLREGDKITLSCKVSNVSEENLDGIIQLNLFDPFTDKKIEAKFNHKSIEQEFKVEAGKSTVLSWKIAVPYDVSAVKYQFVAKAGDFSDGEENVLPILSNRMLVTESLPMPIRGNETKTFEFSKLLNNRSKSLKHHRYTVEFTSNPAWYALQSMPYMMEYPHECAEQTFTRFYSNAIATHVLNSSPKIKTIIDKWGEESPDAFLSNLQKNQELKAVMLEETPWVLNAKSEEQTKRNLSVLLDMKRMSNELNKALGKTIKNQSANGGWPWFPGMIESRYITQHIITGMGHLDHLGITEIKEDRRVKEMVRKGVKYLDSEILRDYKHAQKWDPDFQKNQHISYLQVQYLYARSYFPDLKMDKATTEAVLYYKEQAEKFWLNFNIYGEGMLALASHRFGMKELASDIVKSLKDRSIQHEEFGMYWKEHQVGYYWYQAPIETQALMIEMFDEVADDQVSVEELKIWLLKQKQTSHWKTTKQTSEAVYALLLKGSNLLASDELVEITIGDQNIQYTDQPNQKDPFQVKAEPGTGYFKTAWEADQVKSKLGKIKVSKKDNGIAWGAAYWQYFEDLDKITFAETNLKLQKALFKVDLTREGEQLKAVSSENQLKVGEKVRVRIELRTDRNLEYVHMKDMRAAGFEPINVLSRYHYQDGLGYYQATKDAATHFFFDYIPKGTYVFEYDLRVQHEGEFSNGIASIQCMYAPEFTSHSDGIKVIVQ